MRAVGNGVEKECITKKSSGQHVDYKKSYQIKFTDFPQVIKFQKARMFIKTIV